MAEIAEKESTPSPAYLSGIYSSSKCVYSNYMPSSARALIENVLGKIIKTASPILTRAAPEKTIEIPGDLAALDVLIFSCCSAGDSKLDQILSQTFGKVATAKEATLSNFDVRKANAVQKYQCAIDFFSMKLDSLKLFVLGKNEEVKLVIATQIDNAKEAVHKKMEDESVASLITTGMPYYTMVKDNVEICQANIDPVKAVLLNMAVSVKTDISEKGYVAYAVTSAESIKSQSLEAYEVCKAKGAVQGVKDISISLLTSVATALDEAKKDQTSSIESISLVTTAPDEAASIESESASSIGSSIDESIIEKNALPATEEKSTEEYSSADEAH